MVGLLPIGWLDLRVWDVGHAPGQQHDLLAHIVDEVLGRDVVTA